MSGTSPWISFTETKPEPKSVDEHLDGVGVVGVVGGIGDGLGSGDGLNGGGAIGSLVGRTLDGRGGTAEA